MASSKDFLTGLELRGKWKKKKHELMKMITGTSEYGFMFFNNTLNPYHPAYFKPYECWNPLLLDAHKRAGTKYKTSPWSVEQPGDIYDSLDDALFRVIDVKEYEMAKPQNKSKRISNKHKEACRVIATKLWKKNPTTTIQDMILCDEIDKASDGNGYTEKTLRIWISDLCPNRNAGRRKK